MTLEKFDGVLSALSTEKEPADDRNRGSTELEGGFIRASDGTRSRFGSLNGEWDALPDPHAVAMRAERLLPEP
jgi:hypothetical protein